MNIALLAVIVAIGGAVALEAPEFRRYMKMRQM